MKGNSCDNNMKYAQLTRIASIIAHDTHLNTAPYTCAQGLTQHSIVMAWNCLSDETHQEFWGHENMTQGPIQGYKKEPSPGTGQH